MNMLDKWGQFVNFLLPWFTNGNFPVQSLQACLQSFLGSMLSGKLGIESTVGVNNSTNLVIWETKGDNKEQKHALIPIQLNSLDTLLEHDMDNLNCSLGMIVGKSIKLFYKPQKLYKSICVCEISLDKNDSQGQKLFQLLTADDFCTNEIVNFFKELYLNLNQQQLISEILKPYITNPNVALKTLLSETIIATGISPDLVEESLKDLTITLSYKGKTFPKPKKDAKKPTSISHDTTKFSIDGENFYPKKYFVLNVVKQYVQEHPGITYSELESVFPSETISKERGIVRPLAKVNEWIKDKPDLKTRYCLKDGEIITLSNGEDIVVYNQWGANTFPKFLAIAEKYYSVTSDRDYPNYTFADEPSIVSENTDVEGNYAKNGINVPKESLEKFKNRHNK